MWDATNHEKKTEQIFEYETCSSIYLSINIIDWNDFFSHFMHVHRIAKFKRVSIADKLWENVREGEIAMKATQITKSLIINLSVLWM